MGGMCLNISFWKEKGNKYLIFILLGLLVLMLCIPAGPSEGTKLRTASGTEAEVLDGELEAKLKKVLTSMEGVGEVEVMIMTESSGDRLFSSENTGQKVSGVVVVAEGAGNATVDARISAAVKALFSVDAHKISIVKMRSQEGD